MSVGCVNYEAISSVLAFTDNHLIRDPEKFLQGKREADIDGGEGRKEKKERQSQIIDSQTDRETMTNPKAQLLNEYLPLLTPPPQVIMRSRCQRHQCVHQVSKRHSKDTGSVSTMIMISDSDVGQFPSFIILAK